MVVIGSSSSSRTSSNSSSSSSGSNCVVSLYSMNEMQFRGYSIRS